MGMWLPLGAADATGGYCDVTKMIPVTMSSIQDDWPQPITVGKYVLLIMK